MPFAGFRAFAIQTFSPLGRRGGLPYNAAMELIAIVHVAEEGGYWAEVPAMPGCATQGDDLEELISNLCEAVEGCLLVLEPPDESPSP